VALELTLKTHNFELPQAEERRIYGQLRALERRLMQHPDPRAVLQLTPHEAQREVEADLRVQLSPLGSHLVSHQSAETASHAVRLAVADIERQLERHHAKQRGEPSFGVVSRRAPSPRRAAPPTAGNEDSEPVG
jgi:ribosome-associated translation inhibitor RaiA